MSVHCTIKCVHCERSAHWDDPGGLHQRTPPRDWVLVPESPIKGQASEQVEGFCPECRSFTLGFTGTDPVGLWNKRFPVKATEPGVFEVYTEDGKRFGQVRYGLGQAFLVSQGDAPMDHLSAIATKIGQRFEGAL